jgi:hypothetical protein
MRERASDLSSALANAHYRAVERTGGPNNRRPLRNEGFKALVIFYRPRRISRMHFLIPVLLIRWRLHLGGRDHLLEYMVALTAIERAKVVARWAGRDAHKAHVSLAFRAVRPLDYP